jgi:exosortase D (VPLPA-CTERM-specific)
MRKGWLWLVPALAALIGLLYWDILLLLGRDWWTDSNFSHGFFDPAFSGLFIWQKKKELASLPASPSWSGLALVILALLVYLLGVVGAELFLSSSSFILLLGGLVIYFLGWRYFCALAFPLAFLFLMVPLPTLILSQVTLPLQFLASNLASSLLASVGVPVLREGNIIHLPTMSLEVVEACSGIRSLVSLVTLAIIYGYLLESSAALRVILALAALPVAIAANSLRVTGTGLLGLYWSPEKAEGFFHTFSGWVIFMLALGMLFALHGVLRFLKQVMGEEVMNSSKLMKKSPERCCSAGFSRDPVGTGQPATPLNSTGAGKMPALHRPAGTLWMQFIPVALLMGAAALYVRGRSVVEKLPLRKELSSFPDQIGEWRGTTRNIPAEPLEVLGPGEYSERLYENPNASPYVGLFLAYVPNQRTGDWLHSPKHCLPGAGWVPMVSNQISLARPGGGQITVNRYVIAKGLERQLVLYWYQAHGRVVASEYWAKFFLVEDAIRLNRTDGSLVRVITPVPGSESLESGERRAVAFAEQILPILDEYIPR